jgi:rod shape-determining protein MreC
MSTAPNPLVWLSVFIAVSLGATFANSQHLLDGPRSVVSRVVAPLQTGVSRVGEAASHLTSGWDEVNRLRAENAALKQTVDELLEETVQLRAAELENRELRSQLQYSQAHQDQAPLPAVVISRDSSVLLGNAGVDRGEDAGFADGMTVLAPAGLVGRIVSTTATTSTILLANHPSSSVNAMIQGSPGATGVVNGQADGRLLMRYIPQAEPVKVNDIVVTSGLGGAFPANVPIGRVVHVASRDIDLFQQAVVEPYVNFRQLTHVMVATGFTPAKL